MSSALINLNNLVARRDGVYTLPAATDRFSYSDGCQEEEYIAQALRQAEDLSSLSRELQAYERDWASECHLSPARANLYRAFDFSGVERVLEIGSGCGAISRFLGEQSLQLDCIEGSVRRAEITRLRCRDLDNVCVVAAPLQSLQLPRSCYDLVILTGVIEYAGLYSQGLDPDDAAIFMLERLLETLAPGGRIVIAIENRTGFKYLAGAGEDHFGLPYVGLSNYPICEEYSDQSGRAGICTWDRKQWQKMLSRLSVDTRCSWLYPFPDYKLTSVLLTPVFLRQHPDSAASILSRIHSRDYTALWQPVIDEALFWQTAAATGTLEEFANSFVLVLYRSAEKKEASSVVPFDFVHFSGSGRRPEYRLMIKYRTGEELVQKKRLVEMVQPPSSELLQQHVRDEPFLHGQLLSVVWADRLRACQDNAEIADTLFGEYYRFVCHCCEQGRAEELIDLLPFNILVDQAGKWHFFDQEWWLGKAVSPDFIFFRGIFYFFLENRTIVKPLSSRAGLVTGHDFLDYVLERFVSSSDLDLEKFLTLEEEIQAAITGRPVSGAIREALAAGFEADSDDFPPKDAIGLAWQGCEQPLLPHHMLPVAGGQRLQFTLPVTFLKSPFFQIRLNLPKPWHDRVFVLEKFSLSLVNDDGRRTAIFPRDRDGLLPPLMNLTALVAVEESAAEPAFMVVDGPVQVFHLESVWHDSKEITLEETRVCCSFSLRFTGEKGTELRLRTLTEEQQRLESALYEQQIRLAAMEQSRIWKGVTLVQGLKQRLLSLVRPKKELKDINTPSPEVGDRPMITVFLVTRDLDPGELNDTLASLLAQNGPSWELIILDDNSTSGAALAALKQVKDTRVRVHFLRKKRGIPAALNEGVRIARGQWLTFVGQFDRFRPDTLARAAGYLTDENVDGFFFDEEIIDRSCMVIRTRHRQNFGPDYDGQEDPLGPSLFIRRELVLRLGGFDSEVEGVHLFDLAMRAIASGAVIRHGSETLYQLRWFEEPGAGEQNRLRSCIRQVVARSKEG